MVEASLEETRRELESREEAFGGLGTAILVAVFGVLAVLILEFGSFRSMLIVAGVVPLGIMGGLLALLFTSNPVSFTAMIGFIALIGIEIKNSILLVDFTNLLRRQGKPLMEAVVEAGEIRFLPILLTSVTTAVGFLGLNLSDSPPYRDLGNLVAIGVMAAFVYSLLMLPWWCMRFPVRRPPVTKYIDPSGPKSTPVTLSGRPVTNSSAWPR